MFGDYSDENPFLIVEIDSVENAAKLVSRAILIKEIIELYASEIEWKMLVERVKLLDKSYFEEDLNSKFKFSVEAFGSTIPMQDQIEMINQFAFMPLKGEICLKCPQVIYSIIHDFGLPLKNQDGIIVKKQVADKLYFGKLVAKGGRDAINKFDLKKRKYLGITSMDAELSLIMANQALIQRDSLVFDPFVGTGGFLVSGAHFGGFTMGSDIDGRQIKGKDGLSIISNVEQYSLQKKVIGNIVCDFAHHPWVDDGHQLWDAIICDPPYGVRAGAKKITYSASCTPFKK